MLLFKDDYSPCCLRVDTCGRRAMLEFAKFQQNAKTLSNRLGNNFMKSATLGCLSFFSSVLPVSSSAEVDDAVVIELVAVSLEKEYDKELKPFFLTLEKAHNSQGNDDLEYERFKLHVLVGIYVMKWFKYNNSLATYTSNSLIGFFKHDLELPALAQIDNDLFVASLTALSHYSTFVFHKHQEYVGADANQTLIYSHLNQKFGESIKVDIDAVSKTSLAFDDSWTGFVYGVRQSIGL